MIRVIIADDEPVILRGLKKLLNWDALGIEIIGEAKDGNSAVRMVLEKQPDILISDVCMPGKNGIEVLKLIKENNLHTKVIFLSGYQEFSYVRDALTYGAVDYILKPIDKFLLENTLNKTIKIITEENDELRVRSRLSNYEKGDRSNQIQKYLGEITEGTFVKDNLAEEIEVLGINKEEKYFSVLSMEIDDVHFNSKNLAEKEVQLLKFSIFNTVEQILNQVGKGIVFNKGNYICIVISHDEKNSFIKFLSSLVDKIKENIKNSNNQNVTIGIGEIVTGMDQIPKSYGTSIHDINYKYSLGNDSAISRVKYYIEENYKSNITLETVANISFMNAYYFSSFFKKHTGENFKDYLTKVRMEKAIKVLMSSDKKTYEIAEMVGFSDAKHFSEIFKKYYGKNPMEYKKGLIE